ncbi:DUF6299 family protein [Streptomyces sp. NBC_01003]|nr:DUF6299 family protein [Streptomyces sp. NBC_01003]
MSEFGARDQQNAVRRFHRRPASHRRNSRAFPHWPGRPDRGCRAQPERVSRHDGQEHEWSISGPVDGLMDLGLHEGQAAVDAHLMTLESDGGLPMPRALAGQEEPVRLVDDST